MCANTGSSVGMELRNLEDMELKNLEPWRLE